MPAKGKSGNKKTANPKTKTEESAPAPAPVQENKTQEPATPTPSLASHQMNLEQLRDHTQSRNKQLLEELVQLRNQVNLMINEFKRAVKDNDRLVTLATRAKKAPKKAKTSNGSAKPNGFAKPALLSDELCSFLGKPAGTEMARTEVTKELNKYIKAHNLQNPKDKREIHPDSKLQKLLGLKKNEHFTYFTLQKQITPLFPKKQTTSA